MHKPRSHRWQKGDSRDARAVSSAPLHATARNPKLRSHPFVRDAELVGCETQHRRDDQVRENRVERRVARQQRSKLAELVLASKLIYAVTHYEVDLTQQDRQRTHHSARQVQRTLHGRSKESDRSEDRATDWEPGRGFINSDLHDSIRITHYPKADLVAWLFRGEARLRQLAKIEPVGADVNGPAGPPGLPE